MKVAMWQTLLNFWLTTRLSVVVMIDVVNEAGRSSDIYGSIGAPFPPTYWVFWGELYSHYQFEKVKNKNPFIQYLVLDFKVFVF